MLQIAYIVVQPLDLVNGHPPFDAAPESASLVLGEVVASLGAQQQKDFFQRIFGFLDRRRGRKGCFSERVRDVSDKLCWHFGRRQHIIHQSGGNGATRHAVVFGGFGILRHRHAAFGLDRSHALSPVATSAREYDADGPLVLVEGQGAEEKVNWKALAARFGRFQQLERAVYKGHVPVRRNSVGAVGLDRHTVRNLEDLHTGIAPDQLGKNALVVWSQVLHQDEGHAGIGVGRHAGKEGFKRRQPSGRCADADNGASRGAMLGWRVDLFRLDGSFRLLRLPLFCSHAAELPFPTTPACTAHFPKLHRRKSYFYGRHFRHLTIREQLIF